MFLIHYFKKHFKPCFFILKAFKDILQHFKLIFELVNSWFRFFDVTNRLKSSDFVISSSKNSSVVAIHGCSKYIMHFTFMFKSQFVKKINSDLNGDCIIRKQYFEILIDFYTLTRQWYFVYYQNCSDLMWEKNVLVNEKKLKAENLQHFWDHYLEQFIQTVYGENNVW